MPSVKNFALPYARFLLSGLFVVGFNFAIYSLFLLVQINYLLANAIAFILAGLIEFQINRYWVFKLDTDQRPSLVKFLGINFGMLFVSSAILAAVVESKFMLTISPNLSDIQVFMLAKIPALIGVSLFDFAIKRFFVFNPNKLTIRENP